MGIADEIREKQRKRKIRSRIAVISAIIAAMLCVGGFIVSDVTGVDIRQTVTAEIPKGAGTSMSAEILGAAGAVKYTAILKAAIRGITVQPGKIDIKPGMSYKEIGALLADPNRAGIRVVIPEGYELRQIVDEFVKAGIDREEMTAAVNSVDYKYDFVKEIPERENRLEGYLYPDTYYISETTTAREAVDMMLAQFDKVYDKALRAQAKGRGMTTDEVVTMASVIEREAVGDERGQIAGVFYNRIEKGMKLQSCATVQYILKERKAQLSLEDTRIQSPYNTYINSGLPIGPIASPGRDCIGAALYPEETTALYFVLGKDGQHVFSDTYEQHLKAKEAAGL